MATRRSFFNKIFTNRAKSVMILEADHLMKMVSEEGVDPENARCVTYLSVRDAGDIMEKWDKYRRCEI